MSGEKYDVIVIGLGAVGAAATYQLAERRVKVLGIDRYTPPHEFGSSHGDSRITRIACAEGPQYTRFAIRAHEIWRDLEKKSGISLLTQTGLLVLSGFGDLEPSRDVPNVRLATEAIARAIELPHETLDAQAIRQRFPPFNVEDGTKAYLDRVGGYLRPEACIEAQLALAKAQGATLRFNEQVTRFRETGNSVTVDMRNGDSYHADRLVIAAGSWLSGFLPPDFAGKLRVCRQVLYWFRARSEKEHRDFLPENFPVYIWQPTGKPKIYGFPALGGIEDGIKIATEQYHETTTPETVSRSVRDDEIEKMYADYAPLFPGLSPVCVKAKACLYTMVDKGRFILDHHPESDRILVASPCSGHGFKHSAAVGEVLAKMALNQVDQDLSIFSFDYNGKQPE